MSSINMLSNEMRELIAAGEVVERPASVVKELCENAIDACSDAIEVEIRRSGLELIRVTDNGKGIPKEELPTACLRYATSKIVQPSDLFGISTLGFRGEALAAIGAVSRMRIVSRTADADSAVEYRIESSENQGIRETGAPAGTSVYVRDLFFNVPARMKFLRKDSYESAAVEQTVGTLALSHPEISFRFIKEGKMIFSTPRNGDLFGAIYAIFPRDVADGMLKVSPIDSTIKVSGFTSSPNSGRSSRALQYLFVNNRSFKSNALSAVIAQGYKDVQMTGKYPSFVLNIEIPFAEVDVNVHPAKIEVRFRNEHDVFSAAYTAVRMAVTQYASDLTSLTGIAQFEKRIPAQGIDIIRQNNAEVLETTKSADTKFPLSAQTHVVAGSVIGYKEPEKSYYMYGKSSIDIEYSDPLPAVLNHKETGMEPTLPDETVCLPRDDEGMGRSAQNTNTEESHCPAETRVEKETEERSYILFDSHSQPEVKEQLTVIGELFETYILCQTTGSALFIDKHAAHERLLFDQFREDYADIDRQLLLEPVVVTLAVREKQAILENEKEIRSIGFVIEDFGGNSVAVREIPVWFVNKGIHDAVISFADQILTGTTAPLSSDREWLLHSTACRAAIKAGHSTSNQELIKLANDILTEKKPKFCPHGRPVFFALDKKELEKRFGRA